MIPTTHISVEPAGDEKVAVLMNGKKLDGNFLGSSIAAQYKVFDFTLLILDVDTTKMAIYLLDEAGNVLDDQVIGHYYFESDFENPVVISEDTLEFSFGSRGTLKVFEKPTNPSAFKTKRYLHFDGVTIEV